jgi:hypothetical protein
MADRTRKKRVATVTLDLALVYDLAAQMDRIAEETGRADLRHAARLLRKDRAGGRKPVDDTAALDLSCQLIAAGLRPWSACLSVGRRLDPSKPETPARRLFRKLKINSDKRGFVGDRS